MIVKKTIFSGRANLTSHLAPQDNDPLVYHSNDYKYISDEEIDEEEEEEVKFRQRREEEDAGRFRGYMDHRQNHKHKEIVKTLKALNLKIQPPLSQNQINTHYRERINLMLEK